MASLKIKTLNRLGWCVRNLSSLREGCTDAERAQLGAVIAMVEQVVRQADRMMGGAQVFVGEDAAPPAAPPRDVF